MTCGVTAAGLADGDCAEVDGALVDGDCVTAGGGVTVWLTGGVTGRVGGITGRFAPGRAGVCTPGIWPGSGWLGFVAGLAPVTVGGATVPGPVAPGVIVSGLVPGSAGGAVVGAWAMIGLPLPALGAEAVRSESLVSAA